MTEKLKLDLIQSSKSRSATHGEVERRQNLLDTLTTRVRILNDAADARVGPVSNYESERTMLLSTEANDDTAYSNPWLESDEHVSSLTRDEFRRRQEQVIKEQDAGLDALADALKRQKNIGINIGTEADYQSDLIDDITVRATQTDSRIKRQSDRVGKITNKSSTCVLWSIIIVLGLAIVVVAVVPA
uniref:Uncharacterized protein LOC100180517 n=1 Tax=Phallusia mammillata TaxID=59560 RepID=A0A6F9DHZ6_9ASCI|nr:uncharacterized protein LOC100180517 [Phallusia mammillata]